MKTDAPEAAEADDAPKPLIRRKKRAAAGRFLANPMVQTGIVVVGATALVAIAAAVIGPKRMERGVYRRLRDAVEPQVDRIASEAASLRDQITEQFEKTAPEKRRELAKAFQSWLGHFRVEQFGSAP